MVQQQQQQQEQDLDLIEANSNRLVESVKRLQKGAKAINANFNVLSE